MPTETSWLSKLPVGIAQQPVVSGIEVSCIRAKIAARSSPISANRAAAAGLMRMKPGVPSREGTSPTTRQGLPGGAGGKGRGNSARGMAGGACVAIWGAQPGRAIASAMIVNHPVRIFPCPPHPSVIATIAAPFVSGYTAAMQLRAEALVLAVRAHGEHGAVVRAMTAESGMIAGYVRGGRSRRTRPILQPANLILGEWRWRTEDQLAQLSVELIHSRAPLHAEPLPAAALEWVTVLTAVALPEGQAYPRLHAALDGVIGAIEAAPAARGWAVALVRYEQLLLAELGYGLDHDPLPGAPADWPDILAALRVTGEALQADILADRRGEPLMARSMLLDRLKRAVA